MSDNEEWFRHPARFPRNASGAFFTTGRRDEDGEWFGECLACELPELEAPALLAPLRDGNSDTYFVRQPETPDDVARACSALNICCVEALRYGGKEPEIMKSLPSRLCDYRVNVFGRIARNQPPFRMFWRRL